MNALAVPFRQLVERRLWPLAVLLLAALAAVPVVLGKSTDPAPPASAIASAAATQGATQPIVSVTDPNRRDATRRVLGTRKNPFRPAIKGSKAEAATSESLLDTAKGLLDTVAKPTPSGGSSAPTGPTTTPPAVGVPTAPKPVFELYSLFVRFGDSSSRTLDYRNIKRLTELPKGAPALVYLGLLKDARTAVFLVDADAKVQGDGRCNPSPENCETLRMRPGDTVFIDVPAANGQTKQYQLDLVKIRTRKTDDAEEAARAYAAESKSGRRVLRAQVSRVGPLRYDKRSGTLRRISAKAWKAAIAKAAAAAKAAAN